MGILVIFSTGTWIIREFTKSAEVNVAADDINPEESQMWKTIK